MLLQFHFRSTLTSEYPGKVNYALMNIGQKTFSWRIFEKQDILTYSIVIWNYVSNKRSIINIIITNRNFKHSTKSPLNYFYQSSHTQQKNIFQIKTSVFICKDEILKKSVLLLMPYLFFNIIVITDHQMIKSQIKQRFLFCTY